MGSFFFGLNNFLTIGSAKEPLMRTIPIPLSPKGVEMAAIVSSCRVDSATSLGGLPIEGIDGELLSKRFDFLPFFPLWKDDDFLGLPFSEAFCIKCGVFLKGNVNGPPVMGIKGANGDVMACALGFFS